ncbi:hypothetical protein [Rhodococcus daqingensis]|uniref:Helix-turn-helix domain-containing protein n=1 Tax=Rhodococcus daqingensis TaxID=2479363 RepID=A0ABW2S3J0_9NOCA
MIKHPRTPADRREYRFTSAEAKEPNAVQRLHRRGWPIPAIAEQLRLTVATVRHQLALP